MESNNNNDADDNSSSSNPTMTYLCLPYCDPSSSSTDMLTLTIRTSWIRTVHRTAQAYLHQMTTSSISEASVPPTVPVSSPRNVTMEDILYAYIWHLLTRARIRGGAGSSSSSSNSKQDRDDNSSTSDDKDYTEEVVELFTTVDVVRNVPIQAVVTVPSHSSFLRPDITDETGIPHLRRYALLARGIRTAIDEAVRARLGLLTQHKGQTQEVAPRVNMMAAKRNSVESGQMGLHIVSLDAARGGTPGEMMGMDWYGRERREIGSDLSVLYSSWDKKAEMGVHAPYKPSTPARGEYHAVVWPKSEGGRRDGKWKVHLHLHPLDRQWLRRWVEENLVEAEIVPGV